MTTSASILAAALLAPGFALAGLLLATIPVVIHLLNRRRFRTVDWAAMQFLLQALRRNRRRLRFESWLLMAVRCGVLLLLGLAMARPVGCEGSAVSGLASTPAGLHVILVDNSLSMSYAAQRPAAANHLEHARALAGDLIGRLSPGGEAVAVIAMARPASPVILTPTYDLNAAAEAVARIEPTQAGTDLGGALRLALRIGQENARQPRRRLHIISDGARHAFEGQGDLEPLALELSRLFETSVYALAAEAQANAGVTALAGGASLLRMGFPGELVAGVRGFGAAGSVTARFTLDDAPLGASRPLAPGPDQPPLTQGVERWTRGGLHVAACSIVSDDRLPADNVRWRVLDVVSQMRVLVVEGERGGEPLSGSGAFLALALAPGAEGGYLRADVIGDIEFPSRSLDDYRAVVLAGVPQVLPADADRLERFVRDGGTLLLFMGEAVSADTYNALLLPRGLMPGALGGRVQAGDQPPFALAFDPHGATHPLLRAFAGIDNTGLDSASVSAYLKMTPSDAPPVDVVLPFRGGGADPAVTLHTLGAGRVLFVATSAGPQWTSLPAKPAYVALVHELIAGSVLAGESWLNRTVGERLELPRTLRLAGAASLLDPQQRPMPLAAEPGADGLPVYRSPPLAQTGLYSLDLGGQTMPVAVNVPGDESDLRPLDPAALQAALAPLPVTVHGDRLPPAGAASDSAADYGWALLLAVAALAAAETLLALRFGHHARPAQAVTA